MGRCCSGCLFLILLGSVPNLGKSQFGDLLDPGMFSSLKPDDGPVSLRDLKKNNAVERAMDPDRARVSSPSSCYHMVWDLLGQQDGRV